MTTQFLDLAREHCSTTGTGTTLTVTGAVVGFKTFAAAGATTGSSITYAIEDTGAREIGRMVANSDGTFTRTTLKSTNSDGPLNLSGNAQLFATLAAEDIAALGSGGGGGGGTTLPPATGADVGKMAVVQSDGSVIFMSDQDAVGAASAFLWRCRFDAVGAYLAFNEIEFRETAGTSEASSGGQVAYNGTFFGGYDPINAFDGNLGTSWGPHGDATFIGYNHPVARLVRQVAINLTTTGATPGALYVEYYTSGGWVTAAQFTGLTGADWNSGAWTYFAVPLGTAKGARINVSNARDVNFPKVSGNDGKALVYDQATGKFIPGAGSSGGFSGNYNDLSNKPTLFSGNYADLSGAPTIPSGDSLVPTGGTDGQILTKVSGHPAWAAAPSGGGGGGGSYTLKLTRLSLAADQNVGSGSDTVVAWDNLTEDGVSGAFSSGASTRITAPSGVTRMRVSAYIDWADNNSGSRYLALKKNGAIVAPALSRDARNQSGMQLFSDWMVVTAGDYFEINVYQNSGGTLALAGASGSIYGKPCWMQAEWV